MASSSASASGPRHGLARALSKRGICSRTEATRWIAAGRVSLDGRIIRDPEHPTTATARIEIDGVAATAHARRCIMLNKSRGLVTTARDEYARDTVYHCLEGAELPWLAPVGRLDRASEGLLLMCNDPAWAARITGSGGPDKTYHVQVNALPDPVALARLQAGIESDGEYLQARSIEILRIGERNAWLQVVLDEGRNRHIRRMLAAVDLEVLRLVRVAIGGLQLGTLGKGQWRDLGAGDFVALGLSEVDASGEHGNARIAARKRPARA